jgi:hypothetical protein
MRRWETRKDLRAQIAALEEQVERAADKAVNDRANFNLVSRQLESSKAMFRDLSDLVRSTSRAAENAQRAVDTWRGL